MQFRSALLTPDNELLPEKSAAEVLGVTNSKTLGNWRSEGRHPDLPYVKIGRSIRYRLGDLLDFRARHTVGGMKDEKQLAAQVSTETQAATSSSAQSMRSANKWTKPTDLLRNQPQHLFESEQNEC